MKTKEHFDDENKSQVQTMQQLYKFTDTWFLILLHDYMQTHSKHETVAHT